MAILQPFLAIFQPSFTKLKFRPSFWRALYIYILIDGEEVDKGLRYNSKYLVSVDQHMEEKFQKYYLEPCYGNMPALLPLNEVNYISSNKPGLIDKYNECEEEESNVGNLILRIE